MLIVIGHLMVGLKILAPKLIDLKAALINVEVDITFFKIWSAGLPHLGFGMQRLNRKPSAVADALGVLLRGNKQDFKLVAVGFLVYFENNAANTSTVHNDEVGLTIR